MSLIKKLFGSKTPTAEPVKNVFLDATAGLISIDMQAFNHNLSKIFHKQYNIAQMAGISFIITKFFEVGLKDLRWLAYILATSWHETGFTMQPVTEYGTLKYLKSKSYYPYIGRGFVQITHKTNYEKYGIADNPDMALDPEVAVYILIHGMVNGVFTGRKLSHYFNDQTNDAFNARKIINILDRAARVQEYHNNFMICLNNSIVDV